MRAQRFGLFLALLLPVAGCEQYDGVYAPAEPDLQAAFVRAESPPHALGVLTWNVYVGADVDALIAALATPDPGDDLPTLLTQIGIFQATDWPARAAAIADGIGRTRPHVIGLQEVSTIAIDLTGLGLPVVINEDFLATLQGELAARGLPYAVAAAVTNIVAAPLPGIHLTDRDVILVDTERVDVLFAAGDNFVNNIGVVAPGVELKRGWVLVDAEIAGTTFRFVNTHLESGPGAQLTGLRALQALELVALIGAAPRAVLMGDLNEDEASPMYNILVNAGFTDVWRALRPGVEGLTCCHLSDLSNRRVEFDERIDFVFTRGIGDPRLQGRIDRIGEVPADRIAGPEYPIWPSDHAALAVELVRASH